MKITVKFTIFFAILLILLPTEAAITPPLISLINGNTTTTIASPNRTFELGFFTVDGGSHWYLGIWYASLPIRTYVWVANRLSPITIPNSSIMITSSSSSLSLLSPIHNGRLTITTTTTTSTGESENVIWSTENRAPATEAKLLETGNLLLLTSNGEIVWQSFDFPSDTWLPNMTVTNLRPLVSWRSPSDPSPGFYSLRLRPPEYGELELVFNNSVPYWSTGNWTGNRFVGVPEMTVPYIYSFQFLNPFTPEASFVYSYSEFISSSIIGGGGGVLSRFTVDSSGQLKQYTWSSQMASWNMFWSKPGSGCLVYRRCGSLGICLDDDIVDDDGNGRPRLQPCQCLSQSLHPVDPEGWSSGDFSGGCTRDDDGDSHSSSCSTSGGSDRDGFEEIGRFELDGSWSASFPHISQELCKDTCLKNCSCIAIKYDPDTKLCYNLYGSAYNFRNNTALSVFYLRVSHTTKSTKAERKLIKRAALIIGGICGFLISIILTLLFFKLMRTASIRRKRSRGSGKEGEEEGTMCYYPVTNLKVFTYKQLSTATRGFSEKLGHGGFGAVFRGELPEGGNHNKVSTTVAVAVKRLERPGSGDREFRAEVRTIGSIQHVNLVRLVGFCCEDAHRLLIYDYMPNGSLSAYLTHRHPSPSQNQNQNHFPVLSWESRFRIAIGTAKGIAYLHEECRDCIIHCDIKPENILLDGDCTAKVSDFGLAKLIGRDFSRVLATMRGTWGYVAPEWISGVAITPKADVYSYGMTLLEILGGRRNVEATTTTTTTTKETEDEDGRWYFPPWAAKRIVEGEMGEVVDPRLRGEYNEEEARRVGLVAIWCIQDEEGERPTMGTVVKMLEGRTAVCIPPEPKLLQALVAAGDSFTRGGDVSNGSSSNETSSSPTNSNAMDLCTNSESTKEKDHVPGNS